MQLLVAAVFDSKVGAYSNPMYFRSKGEAIRSFSTAVNDEKAVFSSNKGDYKLLALATFDDNTGAFTSYLPEHLIGADEVA